MNIQKVTRNTDAIIPLMAVFPYSIDADVQVDIGVQYDPNTQLTQFAGRNYSTSRFDESAGGIFESKSDTRKDD